MYVPERRSIHGPVTKVVEPTSNPINHHGIIIWTLNCKICCCYQKTCTTRSIWFFATTIVTESGGCARSRGLVACCVVVCGAGEDRRESAEMLLRPADSWRERFCSVLHHYVALWYDVDGRLMNCETICILTIYDVQISMRSVCAETRLVTRNESGRLERLFYAATWHKSARCQKHANNTEFGKNDLSHVSTQFLQELRGRR